MREDIISWSVISKAKEAKAARLSRERRPESSRRPAPSSTARAQGLKLELPRCALRSQLLQDTSRTPAVQTKSCPGRATALSAAAPEGATRTSHGNPRTNYQASTSEPKDLHPQSTTHPGPALLSCLLPGSAPTALTPERPTWAPENTPPKGAPTTSPSERLRTPARSSSGCSAVILVLRILKHQAGGSFPPPCPTADAATQL